jgi:hypothetical protein
MLEGRRMKGRSPQIGMDDHPGCIDDSTEPGANLKLDLLLEEGMEAFKGKEALL